MSKAVLLGPYIGDFTHEIITFRPYIRYITEITEPGVDIYISSHSNRFFLYDWISPDNFIPVYEHITRDEPNQNGFIHETITKTEFNQITKVIKSKISSDDVEVYNLPYVRNTTGISLYQKVFSSFSIPYIDIDTDVDIVCIFNQENQPKEIYHTLLNSYKIEVMGNMNNGLEEYNPLMRNVMFLNNYLIMFNYINKANMVITNCSEWVIICNLQAIPVFYWGPEFSLFKSSGIMNFDNNRCMSVCDMGTDTIISMIKYHYKSVRR
jgi:hypothetical protein